MNCKAKCKLVIKHDGDYYILGKTKTYNKFKLETYEFDSRITFKNSNKKFRQEVAKHIIDNTPFKNSFFEDENAYKAVSIHKGKFFYDKKIALFVSNDMNESSKELYLPYNSSIVPFAEKDSHKIISKFKKLDKLPIAILYCALFLIFLLISISLAIDTKDPSSPLSKTADIFDLTAFIFTIINYILLLVKKIENFKIKIYKKLRIYAYANKIRLFLSFFSELIMLSFSILLAFLVEKNFSLPINPNFFTGIGISFIFLDSIIDMFKR